MVLRRRVRIGWVVWTCLVLSLAIVYALALRWMGMGRTQVGGAPRGAIPMSSGTVPSSVQNRVIDALANVVPTADVALFPLAGNKVGAYLTVDLGYAHTAVSPNERQRMIKDIDAWFRDVYSGQLAGTIADAEIFFFVDGRVVGGAGLGADAYDALAVRASTGFANVVQDLLSGTQVADQGLHESWASLPSVGG